MTKSLSDQVEVTAEYPDSFSIESVAHAAYYEVQFDEAGILLSLHRADAADMRKAVRMHFAYTLFAEALRDLARTMTAAPPPDIAQREALKDAAMVLYRALQGETCGDEDIDDISKLTPEEEVGLLHLLE